MSDYNRDVKNKNWCGRSSCPHCMGHEEGPEGSDDCPWLNEELPSVLPNRPKHVVMYAMLKWYVDHRDIEGLPVDPDIVVVSELVDRERPVKFYGREYVDSVIQDLRRLGYVDSYSYYGKTIGYILTDEGAERLEEMGVPKQYDH